MKPLDRASNRISERPPRSILVVQAWGIGDLILTTPMLRALRDRWPTARVTLALRSGIAAELLPPGLVDDITLIPAKRHRSAFLLWLFALRRKRIELAIVSTRHHRSWPRLLRLLSGVRRIAADSPGPRPAFVRYHRSVAEADAEHRIDSQIALLSEVAGPVRRRDPEVYVSAQDELAADGLFRQLRIPPGVPVFAVHPGSDPRVPQKRYPGDQLRAAILRSLETCNDAHGVVLFGGEPQDDRTDYIGIHERLHVVADLPLRRVAAFVGRCTMLLAGDTALAHIAAARATPVVVIGGPTQLCSTEPQGARVRIVRTEQALECMPCYGTSLYGACSHISCMRSLSSFRVSDAVLEMLEVARSRGEPQAARVVR